MFCMGLHSVLHIVFVVLEIAMEESEILRVGTKGEVTLCRNRSEPKKPRK